MSHGVRTAMDVQEIYARSSTAFGERVHAVDGRWNTPSPLPGWTVRRLVNHLVNEERWTPPLLDGATIEEVGSRYDGDLLGDDPVAAFDDAAAAALAAVRVDTDAVTAVHEWFTSMETVYRDTGVIGPRVEIPAEADLQTQLLAMMGRTP